MGEDTAAIREEIEQTRLRMGEHADALAYKADVPARTKDRISGAKDSIVSKIAGSTPDRDEVSGQAHRAKGLAQENPLGLAVGAAALGFLAGLVVPSTRAEDEKLGPVADDLKDRAKDLGQDAVERGKRVAGEAAEAAKETAQDSGREQGEQLKAAAAEHADDARSGLGG